MDRHNYMSLKNRINNSQGREAEDRDVGVRDAPGPHGVTTTAAGRAPIVARCVHTRRIICTIITQSAFPSSQEVVRSPEGCVGPWPTGAVPPKFSTVLSGGICPAKTSLGTVADPFPRPAGVGRGKGPDRDVPVRVPDNAPAVQGPLQLPAVGTGHGPRQDCPRGPSLSSLPLTAAMITCPGEGQKGSDIFCTLPG